MAQIVVGVLGVLSASVPLLGNRQDRKTLQSDLRQDLDLLTRMPDGDLKRRFEQHATRTMDELEAARDRRRDPFGITLAICFIAFSTLGGIWAINAGGWWLWSLILVAFAFTLGAGGLAQDMSKKKRDAKGRPVE